MENFLILVSGQKALLSAVRRKVFSAARRKVLSGFSPLIRDHGVDYEREKFEEKLKGGPLTQEFWHLKTTSHCLFIFA